MNLGYPIKWPDLVVKKCASCLNYIRFLLFKENIQIVFDMAWLDCRMRAITRVVSSVGRAAPLQGVGHRFDPCTTHQFFLKNLAREIVDW